MDKVMFIEIGMGIDLHGQNVTKAAVRAVQNAIHHNSMPGLRSVLPDHDIHNMKVNVRLAVPADKEKLNLDVVRAELPYGEVTFEVTDGACLHPAVLFLQIKKIKTTLSMWLSPLLKLVINDSDRACLRTCRRRSFICMIISRAKIKIDRFNDRPIRRGSLELHDHVPECHFFSAHIATGCPLGKGCLCGIVEETKAETERTQHDAGCE